MVDCELLYAQYEGDGSFRSFGFAFPTDFFDLKALDESKQFTLSLEERSWFANPSGQYGKNLEWLVMEGLAERKLATQFKKRSLVLKERRFHASIEGNDLVYLSDLNDVSELHEPFKLYNDLGGGNRNCIFLTFRYPSSFVNYDRDSVVSG